jgi:anti-sigma regulatory factor (Ser/Thr protein kinase)
MTDDGPLPDAAPRNVSPAEQPDLEQDFDNDSLYLLRAAVAAHASRAGLSEGRTSDLVLAVHELAANAIRHGAGRGRLRLWATRDAVHCEVTDAGAPAGKAPDRKKQDNGRWRVEPGHGLWLIRQVADQANLESRPSGTVGAVTFRLEPPGQVPPPPVGLLGPGRADHRAAAHRC